jgi:DNA primase
MRLGLFGKSAADKAKNAGDSARIKADVRALLALPQAAAIAVNEIICADPACPGTETVILVMNPGEKTKAFKAQTAMAELTRETLAAVLAGQG